MKKQALSSTLNPMNLFESVDSLWRAMVRLVHSEGSTVPGSVDPLSIGSDFGTQSRATRELISVTTALANPRNRVTKSTVRSVRVEYLLANVIWTFSGSNRLEQIAFYNRRGENFSDDRLTLAAAPGNRIFRSSHGDQFAACAELLLRDPSSRRAVLSVFTPADVGSKHRDCSCLLSVQFILRQEMLDCIVTMRSQSVLMVFPYDAFLLTMLHEAMAVEIGSELGKTYFNFGSLHYYLDEEPCVERLLNETAPNLSGMPPMLRPIGSVAEKLAQSEETIRSGCYAWFTPELDGYWNGYLMALADAVEKSQGGGNSVVDASALPTWYL